MKSPRKTHNLFGNHIFLKLFCFEMSSKKVQAVRPVSLSLVRMCLFRVYFFPKLFFTAHITSPAPKFENVNTTKCQQLQKNVVTKQNVSFRGLFLTNFYFTLTKVWWPDFYTIECVNSQYFAQRNQVKLIWFDLRRTIQTTEEGI